jgi:serine/threonine protein kinase
VYSHVVYERQVDEESGGSNSVVLLYPKKTTLAQRLHSDDQGFIDFCSNLLQIDPHKRPTAVEALRHPWLTVQEGGEG